MWCPAYGKLHIKDLLPSFKKSRVVIPVAGLPALCGGQPSVAQTPVQGWAFSHEAREVQAG